MKAVANSAKRRPLGWFIGQVMKATHGEGNPRMVNEVLRRKLDE